MTLFLVELWLDGYTDENERSDAELEFIEEALNMTTSSIKARRLDEYEIMKLKEFSLGQDLFVKTA